MTNAEYAEWINKLFTVLKRWRAEGHIDWSYGMSELIQDTLGMNRYTFYWDIDKHISYLEMICGHMDGPFTRYLWLGRRK
jgi:hypothetical protein